MPVRTLALCGILHRPERVVILFFPSLSARRDVWTKGELRGHRGDRYLPLSLSLYIYPTLFGGFLRVRASPGKGKARFERSRARFARRAYQRVAEDRDFYRGKEVAITRGD